MLVTERVGASLEALRSDVDGRAGFDEASREQVARHLIKFADQRAWKVRPESVHVVRADGKPNEWSVTYTAIWSPRAARLVGGEYDGDTIELPRDADPGGLPLDVVRLPYRSSPWAGDDSTPGLSQDTSYNRAGIDPIEDVWVYRLAR